MFESKADFEKLFRSHYKDLALYANRILQDQAAAEDVVQQFFVQLWEKRNSISISGEIKSYMMRSVHNACLNHLKHLRIVQDHHESITAAEQRAENIDKVELEETQLIVHEAVKKLPPQCRKIFIMSRVQEKKYREIADELELSIKTVENQMGKALKTLRTELKKDENRLKQMIQTFFWLLVGVKYVSVVIK